MAKQATATLLTKGASVKVSYADLKRLPEPKKLGRVHTPVPHFKIVDAVNSVMEEAGYKLKGQQLSISNKGLKLFGVSTFQNGKEHGMALGFYSSNDRSIRLRIVAGVHVFVCENLAISGDVPLVAKYHTTHLDVREEVKSILGDVQKRWEKADEIIDKLKEKTLKDQEAESLICRMSVGESPVIPLRLLPDVYKNFFTPDREMTDCKGRHAWALHNSVTRAARVLSLPMQSRVSQGAGRLLGFTLDKAALKEAEAAA